MRWVLGGGAGQGALREGDGWFGGGWRWGWVDLGEVEDQGAVGHSWVGWGMRVIERVEPLDLAWISTILQHQVPAGPCQGGSTTGSERNKSAHFKTFIRQGCCPILQRHKEIN